MVEPDTCATRVTTKAEQVTAKSLSSILNSLPIGGCIPESAEFQEALSALEYFIPEVLREVHSEWEQESLDGVIPAGAEKTGERSISLFGRCILISDQTTVPILVELQVNPDGDKVGWFNCFLGTKGHRGMIRKPYRSAMERFHFAHGAEDGRDASAWAYVVTFGKRI